EYWHNSTWRCIVAGSFRRAIALVSALVLIGIVIWLDVTTTIWQELVILSGLAAGLVTFLLTSLFLDRFIQRATQRHWAPVTRLALTVHPLLRSTIDQRIASMGFAATRQLNELTQCLNITADSEDTELLRSRVHEERRHTASALAIKSLFVATSPAP